MILAMPIGALGSAEGNQQKAQSLLYIETR